MRTSSRVPWNLSAAVPPALYPNNKGDALAAAVTEVEEAATSTPLTYISKALVASPWLSTAIWLQAASVRTGLVTVAAPMVKAMRFCPETLRTNQPSDEVMPLLRIYAVVPLPVKSGLSQNM